MAKQIVIDPGHGGDDSGAVGNGIIEKDYTLKISQYIADRLRELGADVYLTRTKDETVDPQERTKRVLNSFGNNKDVLVISNHINAGGGDGAEVIYALRVNDTLPKLILKNLESQGQNIRKAYQRTLPSNPTKDYYFMLRNTGNTEAMIIEYGFLDSSKDDVAQLKNNWKNYAEAVVKAIAEYTNLNYTTDDNFYTVKAGDSLWNIAKKYNTSVDTIKRLNNLSSNLINIGQRLIIPSINNVVSYTVKVGDTLYKIANEFNTTVDNLMKLNNLSNNLISVGQKLLLPPSNNINQTYTVQKGDTLYKIADEFNTTIDEIKKLNNLNNNILSIGQILKVN
jgi:LysM repeat protein